jgi:hypothetical protein
MSALDWTTAQWADGPALMTWLDARARVVAPDPTVRRRIERWRAGGQASLALVDELLTRLDCSLCEVPDHVWRRYDNGRGGFRARRTAA